MYYVIETNHLDEHDGRTYTIRTEPATDRNGNPVIDGEFGRTIGIVEYAHGKYDTLEEARAAVRDLCGGEFRDTDRYGDPYVLHEMDDSEIESYKPGRYYPMDREETENHLAHSDLRELIEPNYTNEDLERLFDELDAEVKEATGSCLDRYTAMKILESARDGVISERENEKTQSRSVSARSRDVDLEL